MSLLRLNKTIIFLAVVVLCVVIIILGVYLLTQKREKPPEVTLPENAVAIVNGKPVLIEDYERRLEAHRHFYTVLSPVSEAELEELGGQVLEEFIEEILLTDFLNEHGVTVTDEEIWKQIQEIAVDPIWKGDWERYKLSLEVNYHTTLEEVMRTYRLEALREEAAKLKTKKHVFVIWVEKIAPDFGGLEADREYKEYLTETNQPKLEKAEEAWRRAQAGEDFFALAREFSEHASSADKGGDLGNLMLPDEAAPYKGDFPGTVPLFQAVKELGSGQSKFYEAWNGYLIAKITEAQEGPFEEQTFEEWYESFRGKAEVSK